MMKVLHRLVTGLALTLVLPSLGDTVSDTYVATDGDDGNDGLSPGTPLKSVSVAIAKINVALGTVHLAPGHYLLDETITNKNDNARYLVGDGMGPGDVILDGQGRCRVMYASAVTHVCNLTVTNGFASTGHGAGMWLASSYGSLVSNCVFACCTNMSTLTSKFYGGALTIGQAGAYTSWLIDSTFVHNYAKSQGGAACASGSFVVDGCRFAGNWADSESSSSYGGSALYIAAAKTTMLNTVFENNAGRGCGAYFGSAGTLFASNCVFRGNSGYRGGAICQAGNLSTPHCYVDCLFEDNEAIKTTGGAIYLQNLLLDMTNCVFRRNQAVTEAGAAMVSYYSGKDPFGLRTCINCVFADNVVTNGSGGAMTAMIGFMDNCVFTNNASFKLTGNGVQHIGGALMSPARPPCITRVPDIANALTVRNTVFVDNETGPIIPEGFTGNTVGTYYGGAVYNNSLTGLKFENCRFVRNHAGRANPDHNISGATVCGGGAVYAEETTRFDDCRFEDNFSIAWGGAFCGLSTDGFHRCTFVGNVSSNRTTNGGEYSAHGACIALTKNMATQLECPVSDCHFASNVVCNGIGSCIFTQRPGVRIECCDFVGNRSLCFSSSGYNSSVCGAHSLTVDNKAYDWVPRLMVDRSRFVDNDCSGGALLLNAFRITAASNALLNAFVHNSYFKNNRNTVYDEVSFAAYRLGGGGIYLENVICPIENCTFEGNYATQGGGAIYSASTNSPIRNCVFYRNTAKAGTAADKVEVSFSSDDVKAAVVGGGLLSHCFQAPGGVCEGLTGCIISADNPFVENEGRERTVAKGCGRDKGLELSWMAGARDLEGYPRIFGDGPDFGCSEFYRRPGLLLLLK